MTPRVLCSRFPLYVAFPRAEYYHELRLLACLLSPFGSAYVFGQIEMDSLVNGIPHFGH